MILHVDMDAFYASVEQLDNPHLKGRCVIVGGMTNRAVVATASYEARVYGVHSAMPMFEARRRCPRAVIVAPRMRRYKAVSDNIMAALEAFSPLVEPVSIDEAYVDISGCGRLYGPPEHIGNAVKEKIKEKFNLTCSVGIAPNKFLAKIASELKKPDGLTLITPEKAMDFIDTLPVGKVPGVGAVMARLLKRIGIRTLGEINRYPEKVLAENFGKAGRRLIELSKGLDHSRVVTERHHKSVSSEDTLEIDTGDRQLITQYILRQAQTVAGDLRKTGTRANTVTIKIKYSDFKQITRSITLLTPTQSSEIIYQRAVDLFKKISLHQRVRLVGVCASNLLPETMPVQMALLSQKQNSFSWEKIDKAIDTISFRFGKGAVQRASQIAPPEGVKLSQ
ncbi:MAG: DNA polymerase IV [Desulfobacterales bacterium]|nr:DNA polymerase IV [Desulfobacterales bacterium]MDD4391706.1 DNA polymerase IV [Desulfobacterales bacterium]